MNLEGIWWNEFGSQMEIEMDHADRKAFRGVYQLTIGNAQQQRYPLAGRCDDRGLPTKMLAFVVAWNADAPTEPDAPNPSVTAWCGQLQVVDGEEVIAATWILNRLKAPADDWESTLVGMDYFKRTRPSDRDLDLARRHGRASRARRLNG